MDDLHTYEQALRDGVDALKYLKLWGLDVMGLERRCVKALVHLRVLGSDVNACVSDCDTGLSGRDQGPAQGLIVLY